MKDVNEVIERASKYNLVQPKEYSFVLHGKECKFTLYRHYDGRHVSLCNRKLCDAGKDCCHLGKIEGINLCCSLSDYYTLRVSKQLSHLFAQDITCRDEEAMINFAQNILDVISGVRHVEKWRYNLGKP